ncbi:MULTISPECIES: hypothetical protein [Sinimarinibacterium]|uniref:Uncharacterized protein n=1 Tax=Sinimarinibacterium thermocellulolyticum TaxID=3170016 RepID=A0ABV2AA70_9GAMM|nr:hypothetical protein [Sinimarinibacterium flocculans]
MTTFIVALPAQNDRRLASWPQRNVTDQIRRSSVPKLAALMTSLEPTRRRPRPSLRGVA